MNYLNAKYAVEMTDILCSNLPKDFTSKPDNFYRHHQDALIDSICICLDNGNKKLEDIWEEELYDIDSESNFLISSMKDIIELEEIEEEINIWGIGKFINDDVRLRFKKSLLSWLKAIFDEWENVQNDDYIISMCNYLMKAATNDEDEE